MLPDTCGYVAGPTHPLLKGTVPERVLGVFVSCQNGRVGPRHAAFLPAALAMDKLRDPLF